VAYNPDAWLITWEHFITTAIPEDATREYVQQVAGYTLDGNKPEDVVVLCYGPGGTGKSTLIEAMKATLGEYGASTDIGTFTTAHNAQAAKPELAKLAHKRMVAVWEAESGGAVVKLLKAVSGGDVISARDLYESSFEFRPTFTLWLRANKRPRLPHDDSGLWRRIREIPFEQHFNDPDETIRATLTDPSQAGEAILAWMVEGYGLYQAAGRLVAPEAVIRATDEYRREMDTFAEWLQDYTYAVDGAWTSFKRLYESYRKSAGKFALGRDTFSKRLEAAGFERRNGGKNAAGFQGIALVDENYQQTGVG
jgi:putative DNA primase/helicase